MLVNGGTMKKICIIKAGCDSHIDLFRKILKCVENKYEKVMYPDEADVIIHYACGFTQKKLGNIFQDVVFYEKVKKDGAILIFCGCATYGYRKEIFEEFKVIDHVIFGLDILPQIAKILGVNQNDEQLIETSNGILRMTITEGCSKPGGHCSFCKQNYLRIPMKSRYSIEEVCKQVEHYGKPVLILSGLNTTNYGIDFGDHKPKLHKLIHEVSKIPTVKWIQVECVASSCIYEELIEEIENNDKVVYVQYFIQSGSDHMLKEMNIGTTVAQHKKVLERLKGKIIDGAVIVGHPGETMQDVQDTIQFIKDNNLWYTTVLKYMNSEITPSGKMEQLSEEEYHEHCSMVEYEVMKLSYLNMKRLVEQGVVGYVEKIYTFENALEIMVKPLEFEGYCFVPFDEKVPVNIGDKVIVHNPKIKSIKIHSFEGGTLEVIK